MAWTLKCWPFHNWSKWTVTEKAEVLRKSREGNDDWRPVGYDLYQERKCSDCGFVQTHVERSRI